MSHPLYRGCLLFRGSIIRGFIVALCLPFLPSSFNPSSFLPLFLSPALPPSVLQAKPRPPSTLEGLLQVNGLQHFSELLITNGYGDMRFITEISEAELHEIGITQASDRSKVRPSHSFDRLLLD